MPTPFTHLALAEEILRDGDLIPAARRLLTAQRGPFLLGNTAPDVQTVSGQPRHTTHFYRIPPTGERPAYETLFATHPALARAADLPPAQAAFVAGYIAHLLLDEMWLFAIFRRYFLGDWAPRPERHFVHNVLRTWLDRQDQAQLDGDIGGTLRRVEPHAWLPFVGDEYLRAWRDWLAEQLEPGHESQTAAVFARRMGRSPEEMEAVLRSPALMDERVFGRVSPATLDAFRREGRERSARLINRYLANWEAEEAL